MKLPVRIDFDGPHEKYPDQVAITVRRPDTGEPIGSVRFPVLYLDGLIHGKGGCSTMIELDFDLAR